jgi:exosortase A-associated hydrolase 2
MAETPFFFPSAGHSLFGVVHEPDAPTRRGAFVFCHPLAEEKLWAHRVFVSFARRLAHEGYVVLRFDYMGNGDSEGEFGASSLETALSDVRCAIGAIRERSGVAAVNLLGLRWGGTIASLVAESEPGIERLILWAPIVDGTRYMQDLLRTNLTTQLAAYKEIRQDRADLVAVMESGRTVNIDGYEMALPLYAQASSVKLAGHPKAFGGPCLIAQVDPQPGRSAPDLQQLAATYPQAMVTAVQEEPFWKEILRWYDEAPNLSAATLQWLEASRA